MAGYITQTRMTGNHLFSSHFTSNGVKTRFDGRPIPSDGSLPSQVTTGYRTGAPDVDPVLDYEPHTWGGASRALRTEYVERNPTSRFDTGHTFSTVRKDIQYNHRHVDIGCSAALSGIGATLRYEGPLVLRRAIGSITWPATPAPLSTGWYERTAISNTIPTRSAANLAVSLGELLKDGLPSLPGRMLAQRKSIQAAGHEYLNLEFAIRPLINDVKRMCRVVTDATRIIDQFERDSGRTVRRSRTFPSTHTNTILTDREYGSGYVMNPTNTSAFTNMFMSNGYGYLTHARSTSQNVWFSAGYSYYVPPLDDYMSTGAKLRLFEQKAQHLLGLRITPELLWELAPWSWLIDWVWSIQSYITNVTLLSSDSLVMRYAYLMYTSRVSDTWTLSRVRLKDGTFLSDIDVTLSVTRKERVKASPYGFGLNPSSFTGRQWGILAALGMTKSPGALR